MESHSKIFGHPLHPILITLPLGLLTASLAFDALAKWRKNSTDAKIARALVGGGVLTGLLAALPGLVDYLAIPAQTRAKQVGTVHGLGNVVMLSIFALSWRERRADETQPSNKAVALSLLGATLASATGWLGGELVYRLNIGVDDGAHENAPNSLLSEKA